MAENKVMQEHDPLFDQPKSTVFDSDGFQRRHHASVESMVTLLDWLLVAFILALVFQAFAIQAFQIPTGSMAETLRGDHFRMRCVECGYAFDTGSDSMSLDLPQCPNCRHDQPPETIGPLVHGDRIFVLKCIYQFFEPSRWDVVVFKNPVNPRDNYIKRLIGLPGESVRLIDGDVYIDGRIVRKPARVQEELWMPIYLQGYPSHQSSHQPFVNAPDSDWRFEEPVPRRFTLDQPCQQRHTLAFNSTRPDDFGVIYGYNDSSSFAYMPISSDLMIRFQVKGGDDGSVVGAALEKYGVLFGVQVEMSGAISFLKHRDGQWVELRRILTDGILPGVFTAFEFANVDRQLVLHWGKKRFTYDLTTDPDLAGVTAQTASPAVQVFGAGRLDITDVQLYRDIYYIDGGLRATASTPFVLADDEFFVCGDNTPNSLDSRLWMSEGLGNHGIRYREGIVPRAYMMGKAVMVYWSQSFRPRPTMAPVVPNFNNIKLIFGGSEELY